MNISRVQTQLPQRLNHLSVSVTMAPRKRKASEFDDAPAKQAKGKKRAKQGRPKKQQLDTANDAVPFKALSGSDPQAQEGAYRNTTTLRDEISASYAVKPDTWGQIKQYTNVKCMAHTACVAAVQDANECLQYRLRPFLKEISSMYATKILRRSLRQQIYLTANISNMNDKTSGSAK